MERGRPPRAHNARLVSKVRMTRPITYLLEVLRKNGPLRLRIKVLAYPLNILSAFYFAAYNVRRHTDSFTLEQSVSFAFDGCRGLIRPFQHRGELLEFLRFFAELKPKFFLEIGTATGGTLFLFSRLAQEGASIVSVDLPYGRFGGGYPVWRVPLYKSFVSPGQRLHLLREDSHSAVTVKKVQEIVGAHPLDLLYIDGDHTYEGVKQDFMLYSPLVRTGGAIVFHDIAAIPLDAGYGVHRFWQEIKEGCRHREFFQGGNQIGGGFGVCFVSPDLQKRKVL